MKKSFTKGTPEAMMEAFSNKIAELSNESISSATYIDVNGMFGEPGATITDDEARNYWEDYQNDDPVLQNYTSFEEWWYDTQKYLQDAVESCESISASNNDCLADSDLVTIDRYLSSEIPAISIELSGAGLYDMPLATQKKLLAACRDFYNVLESCLG